MGLRCSALGFRSESSISRGPCVRKSIHVAFRGKSGFNKYTISANSCRFCVLSPNNLGWRGLVSANSHLILSSPQSKCSPNARIEQLGLIANFRLTIPPIKVIYFRLSGCRQPAAVGASVILLTDVPAMQDTHAVFADKMRVHAAAQIARWDSRPITCCQSPVRGRPC